MNSMNENLQRKMYLRFQILDHKFWIQLELSYTSQRYCDHSPFNGDILWCNNNLCSNQNNKSSSDITLKQKANQPLTLDRSTFLILLRSMEVLNWIVTLFVDEVRAVNVEQRKPHFNNNRNKNKQMKEISPINVQSSSFASLWIN